MSEERLLLGVNIDHVATLRQARYAPDPAIPQAEPLLLRAAQTCASAGADSLTLHLREDRRHIQDADVYTIRQKMDLPLNLEMGNTAEILAIALDVKPDFVCLVPESREEVTTEGGLDADGLRDSLQPTVAALQNNGTKVSLFLDPDLQQLSAASELNADMVELHTGAFANGDPAGCPAELQRLIAAAEQAYGLGLQVNAGHGINLANIERILEIPYLTELNIGHHLVSESIFIGLEASVRQMREAMGQYRSIAHR